MHILHRSNNELFCKEIKGTCCFVLRYSLCLRRRCRGNRRGVLLSGKITVIQHRLLRWVQLGGGVEGTEA